MTSPAEALRLADAFRARVVAATPGSFVFELTGATDKLDTNMKLVRSSSFAKVNRSRVAAIVWGQWTI